MDSRTDIISDERKRLEGMGITAMHINVCEGKPIVIVDPETLGALAQRVIDGQFIAEIGENRWAASCYDSDGKRQFKDNVSEMIAYRFVLGYPVGRNRPRTYFAYETPRKRPRDREFA